MKGRMLASVVMTAIGASLLAAAMFASTASGAGAGSATATAKKGGTITTVSRSDFDYVDPGLAYFSHSWNMMSATNLTLLYYPHTEGPARNRLAGMASPMPRVSNGGKTYVFTVKKGFRFSDGKPVTAANFKRAFDRGKNATMQSPASSFMDDIASYSAKGQVFTVTLKQVAPDFLARMTMQFFSAVPVNLPFTAEGIKAPVVSAGPYYLKEWNAKNSALAVRNPYWKNNQEPFKSLGFAANVDQLRWIVGPDPATQRLMCERGEADLCSFPPAQAKELADKYGINKSQFYVKPQIGNWYLAMNTSRGIFQNNTKLRQAVANAIDRRFMVAQHGYLAGNRSDQFIPMGMPGFKNFDIYSLKGPNYAKAKPLAQGNTRDGKAVMYTYNTSAGPPIAQSVQFNLKQIGIDVEIKLFDRVVQHEKTATRGEPFDLTLEGWLADYPDPANFINVLLDGRRIQADNNVNASYFNNATFNARMDQAYKLAGDARTNAYAILDRDMMKDQAPVAPYISTSARWLTSTKVGCFQYSGAQGILLTQICTKSHPNTYASPHTPGGGSSAPPAPLPPNTRFDYPPDDVVRYLIRRLLWACVLFIAVTFVTYVIFFIVPANPARLAAGQSATPERVHEVEKFLGLDQPFYVQYVKFLKRLVLEGSLGQSFVTRQSVNEEILRAAPITASLVFGAMLMVLSIAIPLGIFSALRPRSLLDRVAMVYVLIGISLPSFWIGLVLSYLVGYKLGLTPIAGYCEVFSVPEAAACGGLWDWAYHMILPCLTLAIVVAGTYVRFVRAEVMETLTMDYVRTARAKGAPERTVIRSHVLRNAMLPVVTMVGMDIGLLLGGAIFIEAVFGLNGLGGTALESIGRFDLPVLQGVVIFGAIAIIIFSLVVDLLYAWIDPRIRLT